MIIKLHDISESLAAKGTVDGSKFARPEDSGVSLRSPIAYNLTLARSGDHVWIHGPVEAALSLTCDRCLDAYSYVVRADLDIELIPKEKAPDALEVELKREDLDQYYYEGEDIDLDPYVFEEVMLNMPIKALCSESCRGICPMCGKNLNLGECRCEKTGTTMLGEKLKSFLKT
jgi:uncharacterized protein